MSQDPAVGLIGAIIENLRTEEHDWSSFSLIVGLENGEAQRTWGYLYWPGSKSSATSVRPSFLKSAVAAYLADRYLPGDGFPVAMLVQFDRDLGQYEVTFEDHDASRWKVTPNNIDEIPEALRPDFS